MYVSVYFSRIKNLYIHCWISKFNYTPRWFKALWNGNFQPLFPYYWSKVVYCLTCVLLEVLSAFNHSDSNWLFATILDFSKSKKELLSIFLMYYLCPCTYYEFPVSGNIIKKELVFWGIINHWNGLLLYHVISCNK